MENLYKISAFTKDSLGGNRAGVYMHADHLSEKDMQSIAYDLGYSETAFVLKSEIADYKVRFFTPTTEVDLCGHASIATFFALRQLNIINNGLYTQETKAGLLKVKVDNQETFIQLSNPRFFQKVEKDEVASSFDYIEFDDFLDCYVVSTGIKEIFVPVKNKDVLDRIVPRIDQMIKVSNKYDAIGMHVFAIDNDIDAYGRNFAPIVGIDEESATGTSNGALACYLHKFLNEKQHYTLRQGYSMGEPSELRVYLNASYSKIMEVWVGGTAKFIES